MCREYPPVPMPAGGIGTYVYNIAELLAAAGEIVHVVGQLWPEAPKEIETFHDGRLIIHRLAAGNHDCLNLCHSISLERIQELNGLLSSSYPQQSFSWQACHLIENLVVNASIDIIEAQEYEAPLYYFQLRRALGLGPAKQPPCFVHLHSPTQLIAHYNDNDLYHPYFLTARRLEAHSIASADGLLCPSHYLSRQAESLFGFPKGAIEIIPLPIGHNELLKRDGKTWKHGSICYIGRLERRKGILEWIDAAVTIAPEYPEAIFDFIGADCLSTERVNGKQLIESRIPEKLKSRFRFWGAQERSQIYRFLLQARMAVVPSRWENFPNTCVEAMCSGLPVIASPEGGMAEMVTDNRNGWLAANAHPSGLAEALKRALDTEPEKIACMGQNAAEDIHRLCDNREIVKRHLDFRARLIRQGAGRSLHLSKQAPCRSKPLLGSAPRRLAVHSDDAGIAVVISCPYSVYGLDRCLKSIEAQTHKPLQVVVLTNEWMEEPDKKILHGFQRKEWKLIRIEHGNRIPVKNLGIAAVLESEIKPLGFVFLEANVQLNKKFIELANAVFVHCPEVALVSGWVEDEKFKKVINTTAYPSFPFQWLCNELVSFSAVRTEALIEAKGFRTFDRPEYENWDLFNTVMVAGWTAVTLPAILGIEQTTDKYGLGFTASKFHGRMCKDILEKFPDLVAQDAAELLLLAVSSGTYLMNAELDAARKKLALTENLLHHPRAILWKLLYRLKNKLKKKLRYRLAFPIDNIWTSKQG